mmetsp:Transcript_49891/g.117522  ORF Transcript_49891/g.117522 Transcript_49891/m.117522 type:complete len:562 (+) Transcript_49891:188-1873(+)
MDKSAVWDGSGLEAGWISKRSRMGGSSPGLALSIEPTEEANNVNLSESGSFREGLLHISQQGTTIHSATSALSSSAEQVPSPHSAPSTGSRSTTSAKRGVGGEGVVRYELSHGDFENMEVIGRGSSGYVRKALRKSSNQVMALKVINVFEEEKRKQMMQEVVLMCDHIHDGIIRFYGAFFYEGTISVALEYMTGGSLSDVIKLGGAIPEPVLSCMAKQILEGMTFMHERKQVHRDFKPCNLLIDHTGQVKITDFGVAAELDSSQVNCTTFVGTFLYMSPERFGSEPYSFPSDVWSLGLVLIECATAEYPYLRDSGKTYWALMDAIVKEPPPILDASKGFSSELHDLVTKCLVKDPKGREKPKTLRSHAFCAQGVEGEEGEEARKLKQRQIIARWLGTVRSCFVSGNVPSASSFKAKDAGKDFSAFYLSYFTAERREMLWSLYTDESELQLVDPSAVDGAPLGSQTVKSTIKGRDGIMTHIMSLPIRLDPRDDVEVQSTFDENAETLAITCPCTARELPNSRGKGEYHGEVDSVTVWFKLKPSVSSKSYTILKQTMPDFNAK